MTDAQRVRRLFSVMKNLEAQEKRMREVGRTTIADLIREAVLAVDQELASKYNT